VSYIKGGSRLKVFENKLLRRILGPRGMRIGSGDDSTIFS
jgi:hypothetical protein